MGPDDELAEAEARGWYDVGTFVCSDCMPERALAQALRDHNTGDACSYCGLTPVFPAACAPIEMVLSLIHAGLRLEYEAPIEHMAYDEEFVGPVHDLADLLWDFGVTERDDLHKVICGAILQEEWCQRDPYATPPTEALKWGWAAFRDFVRGNNRLPHEADSTADGLGAGDIAKHDMPLALVDAVRKAGLVRTLPPSSEWWRIRVHKAGDLYTSAADLGTPANQYARHNRMSPKGVGAFYGASTREGARAEVAGYAGSDEEGTIGLFRTTVALDVLDLTDLPEAPSLFDPDLHHLRAPLAFLAGFVEDITEVAEPLDKENLAYIPTQKTAEIFRTYLRGPAGPLTGILWRSSKDTSVTCCVLFIPSTEVADAGRERGSTKLSLDPTSVETLAALL